MDVENNFENQLHPTSQTERDRHERERWRITPPSRLRNSTKKSGLASAAVSTQEKVKSASLEFLIFNALTGTDLPIPTDLSIQEIERATKHFNASIFKDWTILNATLKRYEATIQKRWMYVSCLQNSQQSISPLMWRLAITGVAREQRAPRLRAD